MIQRTLQAVHAILFGTAELTAIVGNRISYARAPVTSTYPQVIYFDVSSRADAIVDYDKVTAQISCWSTNKFEALSIQRIIYNAMLRYRGPVDIGGDTVDINWTELIESAALPQDDPQLYGYQTRFELRTKGANIGG